MHDKISGIRALHWYGKEQRNARKNLRKWKGEGIQSRTSREVDLEKEDDLCFLNYEKRMNNGLEKFSSSEAKEFSKPVTMKARSSAERVTVVALRAWDIRVTSFQRREVWKNSRQKQRGQFRLQRKETKWLCFVVFRHTWHSEKDGIKVEGAVCSVGDWQGRDVEQKNSSVLVPLRQVSLVCHSSKK